MSVDELYGESPRVAQHDETVTIAERLQIVGYGCSRPDQAVAFGLRILDTEGEVKQEWVH